MSGSLDKCFVTSRIVFVKQHLTQVGNETQD